MGSDHAGGLLVGQCPPTRLVVSSGEFTVRSLSATFDWLDRFVSDQPSVLASRAVAGAAAGLVSALAGQGSGLAIVAELAPGPGHRLIVCTGSLSRPALVHTLGWLTGYVERRPPALVGAAETADRLGMTLATVLSPGSSG